jgi:hypothetical protein
MTTEQATETFSVGERVRVRSSVPSQFAGRVGVVSACKGGRGESYRLNFRAASGLWFLRKELERG